MRVELRALPSWRMRKERGEATGSFVRETKGDATLLSRRLLYQTLGCEDLSSKLRRTGKLF